MFLVNSYRDRHPKIPQRGFAENVAPYCDLSRAQPAKRPKKDTTTCQNSRRIERLAQTLTGSRYYLCRLIRNGQRCADALRSKFSSRYGTGSNIPFLAATISASALRTSICQGADPRQLPTEGHRALHALICLVEAAYHLVRNAEASLKNGDRYQDSRLRENAVELQGKVLKSLDIQYIFSEYGSPRARTQFAFRRIVIQRVDRFNVGGKSSKHRFGLTRRFGRHEEKIRFLALLTCANSYPRTARSRNRSLLSPGQAMMSASEFASIRARRFLTKSAIAPHRPGQGHALFRAAGNMIAGRPSRFDGCP